MVTASNKPIYIVGGDSLIGKKLASVYREKGASVVATTRRRGEIGRPYLDLANGTFDELPEAPGIAFLCAAITSVAVCETERDRSVAVNVNNTKVLCDRLADLGQHVVFFSTNLVFDGKKPFPNEDSVVSPASEYGRQKTLIEDYLRDKGLRHTIIRLTKVVHSEDGLFGKWKTSLEQDREIEAFSNARLSPIPLDWVASMTTQVVERQLEGIIHFGSSSEVSYYEGACCLCETLDLPNRLVKSVPMPQLFPSMVPHPSLGCQRLRSDLGLQAPDSYDVIRTIGGMMSDE